MRITVAICTWNRAGLLDQTLGEMRQLRIPVGVTWELLVVNNNCTDNTDEVIVRHSPHLPLRRIFESKPGLSHARNRALEEASGELLMWTDDDVLVDPDWVSSLVNAAIRYPSAAAFGGPVAPWFPVEPDPQLLLAFPALRIGFCGVDHGLSEGALPPGKTIFGANMAYRSSSVGDQRFMTELGMKPSVSDGHYAVGGYEEIEFLDRLRQQDCQIVWVPEMRVKHYVGPDRMTEQYLARYIRELGRNKAKLTDEYEGRRILGVPRWVYRKVIESRLLMAWYRMTQDRQRRLICVRTTNYYHGVIQGLRERNQKVKDAHAAF